MEKITELLDKLKDLEKLIPKMDKLVEIAHWLMSISVRIGPLCILFLGVIYLLIPPRKPTASSVSVHTSAWAVWKPGCSPSAPQVSL